MKTCETCSYWEIWPPESSDSDDVERSCKILGMDSDKREDNIRVYSDSMPITTEKNFGCIHHKGKE